MATFTFHKESDKNTAGSAVGIVVVKKNVYASYAR